MSIAERWHACTRIPAVRTTLMSIGFALMILSPLAGVVPGPGGILVFAAGLALVLRYSEWAKRKYVRLKRRHPRTGEWADWGLRRPSAARRRERDKALAAADADQGPGELDAAGAGPVVQSVAAEAHGAIPLHAPTPASTETDEDGKRATPIRDRAHSG